MATAKDKKEVDNDLYDLGGVPSTENTSPARIETSGIIHNLKPKFEMVSGDYKNEEAKAASEDGKWYGFQITLTDPEGLEFSEIYFKPPTDPDTIKYPPKWYDSIDGKSVSTRDANGRESVKIFNNEFLAFLIDCAEAIGYKHNDITEHLYKNAKGFQVLGQAFIDKFKVSENTRVSAKLLWNNNKNKGTSFLKLHGSYPVYYPFGNDLLDVYQEGRPTVLKLSNYEITNGTVKKYTGTADAPGSDAGAVYTPDQGGFQPVKGVVDDPF